MTFIAWILAFALLTWLFNGYLDKQRNPNRNLDTQLSSDGASQVTLQRNRYGHYVLTGKVNGKDVDFLLDTGATSISIPADTATKLGLRRGRAYQVNTANGSITVYNTVLRELRLGKIVLRNVRANINPHMRGTEALLGMSALKKLEFTQRGKTLTLRQIR
jgi:aspartyl protease family protein